MLKFFLLDLKNIANPIKAVADKKYHKSARDHLGISVPECRQKVHAVVQKSSEAELLALARGLWETDLYDPMLCATLILSHPKVKPSLDLWEVIIRFLQDVDGWALEDQMAHAAWKCILFNDKLLDQLEEWTTHPNFWMRRAALVYTLPFAKPGKDPERPLKWAASYVADREWFIQKAIGWWLRVLGEHNPERVIKFLKEHGSNLMYVAKREATRKLLFVDRPA